MGEKADEKLDAGRISRRDMLEKVAKGAAIAGALQWVPPVIESVTSPAFADVSGGACYLYIYEISSSGNGCNGGMSVTLRTVAQCASPTATGISACSTFTRQVAEGSPTGMSHTGPTCVADGPTSTFSVTGTCNFVGQLTRVGCAGAAAITMTSISGQSYAYAAGKNTDNHLYLLVSC